MKILKSRRTGIEQGQDEEEVERQANEVTDRGLRDSPHRVARGIWEEEEPEYVGGLGAPQRRLKQHARTTPIVRGYLAATLGRARQRGPVPCSPPRRGDGAGARG